MNPESRLEEQSAEFGLCIEYWYVKAFVIVPVSNDEIKYTMSHRCLNETVLFQSIVAYVSAKQQFVLWPTRVPTALREWGVHSYRVLSTVGDRLASKATITKPETVIRGPNMWKDGAKQFDAIYVPTLQGVTPSSGV